MARPQKLRSVRSKPYCSRFQPLHKGSDDIITLSLDEYETLRWIDFERLSQENCALRMDISRTTVQRMYASAREKVAQALVLGQELTIEGGSIHMETHTPISKKATKIRIAIGLEGDKIASHFGHCDDFRVIDIDNGVITALQDVHDSVHTHHQRPQYLKNLGVETIIINGLGKGAYNRLLALDIQCLDGQGKSVKEALEAYLNQNLTQTIEAHECQGHHEGHTHG